MSKKPVADWTVMVFMADRNNLEPFAAVDIQEMMQVGSSDKLNVLVQIGSMCGRPPQRFLVHSQHCEACGPTAVPTGGQLKAAESHTGNPAVLADFLNFARSEHTAKHYMLILWGHFVGIGFGKVGNDSLTLVELKETLAGFKKLNGARLDILGGDTCNMSFAEAAYELRDVVSFMVTSEIATQFQGWPYKDVLGIIQNSKGTIEPEALGRQIADKYVDSYKPPPVSLTVLNLQHADDLAQDLKEIVEQLKRFANVRTENAGAIFQAFLNTHSGKLRPLIDLIDLCRQLQRMTDDEEIQRVMKETIEALNVRAQRLIAYYRSNNDASIKPLTGLGIYAPFVTTENDWYQLQVSEALYKDLQLARRTGWGDLVFRIKHSLNAPKRAQPA